MFDNPLANMDGPDFLMLFLAVMAGFAIWGKLYVINLCRTDLAPLPLVPDEPDPFDIAYLRGGVNELLRVVVYALLQRGDLQDADGKLVAVPGHESELSKAELAVYRRLSTARAPSQLLHDTALIAELQQFTAPMQAQYERQQLLVASPNEAGRRFLLAFGLVTLLGVYKIVAAIAHNRTNIGLTIFFLIIFPFVMKWLMTVPRLTRLGTAYLDQLRVAFANAKTATPEAVLAVAVFGVGILAGTTYASYSGLYRHQAADGNCGSSCSSCGSSCSSGSSSCSSGGSSCGGGGGCGGCGGG